jgi:hypothetical protein
MHFFKLGIVSSRITRQSHTSVPGLILRSTFSDLFKLRGSHKSPIRPIPATPKRTTKLASTSILALWPFKSHPHIAVLSRKNWLFTQFSAIPRYVTPSSESQQIFMYNVYRVMTYSCIADSRSFVMSSFFL